MSDLARAVEAANGFWPVLAIAIIGVYVLVWRFGNQLLSHSRDTLARATEAEDSVRSIRTAIVTNHGSTSLGDSIDRLTVSLNQAHADIRNIEKEISKRDAVRDAVRRDVGVIRVQTQQMYRQFDEHLRVHHAEE